MARKDRKIRKLRGSRNCGWGRKGQHRKKGMRGGVGKAGRNKHKWSWTIKYAPNYFGKRGFTAQRRRVENVVNVGELEDLAEKLQGGKTASAKKRRLIDLAALGFTKLLGRGGIASPITVKVSKATETAIAKITQAGGEVMIKT